jgi:chorismate-pyruvate lyase
LLITGEEAMASALNAHTAVAHALTRRHFLRHGERPTYLGDVEIAALDPCLRTLLFTDGTVTRTLEVQTLERVRVEVVDQHWCRAPESAELYLGLDGDEECVQRRVKMTIGETAVPAVWAESHIIPARLPEGFLRLLEEMPEGIGESLQHLMLESARELLWFGLGTAAEWTGAREALTRLYRVTAHGETALLISESFAVESRDGLYSLAHPTGAATDAPHLEQGRGGSS